MKRKPNLLFDVAPVIVILLDGVLTLLRAHPAGVSPVLLGLALIADAAALSLSRRAPVLVPVFALAVALTVGVEPTVLLPVLFALFAVARHREWRVVARAVLLSAVAVTLSHPVHGSSIQLPSLIPQWVAIGLAVAVGMYVRARAEQDAALAEQIAAEERVRIARELHDVVAHSVSLLLTQPYSVGQHEVGRCRRAHARRIAAAEPRAVYSLSSEDVSHLAEAWRSFVAALPLYARA